MSEDPLLPAYGRSTLADLLPAVAAHLGVPGYDGDEIGLPSAARYVVAMVDGLGLRQLAGSLRDAPYLASLFGGQRRLTSGVPSTTGTSLTSLGTGLPPGRHGIVGYTFRNPVSGELLNCLTWSDGPDPVELQPHATVFERLSAAGMAVSSVLPERFECSGLTRAGLRGPLFVPVPDERDFDGRIPQIVTASRRGPRSVTYVYERLLDHTGHARGVASSAWLRALGQIDEFLESLSASLDADTCLLITGDHGMVDVPRAHRIITEQHPDLTADLTLLAGEGRLRQLYSAAPESVAQRWRDHLRGRAWILTRDEAIDAGWFGTVDDRVVDSIGDVVVAMRGDWAIMTETLPGEMTLVGMHGSLTPAEMEVPLLIDHVT